MMGMVHAQKNSSFAAIPPLTSHVTDAVGMLNAQQKNSLEGVLTDYEQRTGSQIGILLIGSTAPEMIDQYSIRVADAWKLGRKKVDDGVLLIVAKDNPKDLRRLRIEVGRGVQGTLTDAQSKRILEDIIAPHFRQNDFYGGLAAAVSAITTLLDQEHLPAPAVNKAQHSNHASNDIGWWPFLLFAFFVIIAMRRSKRTRHGRGSWGANASGVILGAVIDSLARGGGSGRSGGGGGFSGGGGGFDGGGASGDW